MIPKANENEGKILINHAAVFEPDLVELTSLKIKNTTLTIAPMTKCIKKLKSIALPSILKRKLKA